MTSISKSAAWKALQKHRLKSGRTRLEQLFAKDATRPDKFSIELPGLRVDYSRNHVTTETMRLLLRLAATAGLEQRRIALFEGAMVNDTEQRAALHTLLRAPAHAVPPGLRQQAAAVSRTLARMRQFVDAVHGGAHSGVTGERFTDVVSIGIGGSHLGPELVVEALAPLRSPALRVHFISNLDPMHAARVLARLNPARTLAIITSKSFTTQETLANAQAVRAWLVNALGQGSISQQCVAVTAAPGLALEFGLLPGRVFEFWDWVGGRYSLWSAVGLPIALASGMEAFQGLLRGAARMDRHFGEAPLDRNLPVLLALIGIWYANFWKTGSRAIIPYRQDLRLLVPYLQQLEMESCGKRVTRGGRTADYSTAPVVWGDIGTNAQHAFFQLLHQGTPLVPVDFIAVLAEDSRHPAQQELLLANCFAQAQALMLGRSLKTTRAMLDKSEVGLVPYKIFPGDRPSTLLILDRLDAETLGLLLALYEHRTFVQACIWDINPFDQMGVELGKRLAEDVARMLTGASVGTPADPATQAAVDYARRHRT
jgi:glucose-6-phosphate isomerase